MLKSFCRVRGCAWVVPTLLTAALWHADTSNYVTTGDNPATGNVVAVTSQNGIPIGAQAQSSWLYVTPQGTEKQIALCCHPLLIMHLNHRIPVERACLGTRCFLV